MRFRGVAFNAHPGCIVVNPNAGIRERETSGELVIRVFRLALPYLPTKAEMRESKVYLTANRGVQVSQDGTERELYAAP